MSEAYEIGIELAGQSELSGSLEIILEEFAAIDAAIIASNAAILTLMGENPEGGIAEVPYWKGAGAAPEIQSARTFPLAGAEVAGVNRFGSNDVDAAATPTTPHLGTPSEVVAGHVFAPGEPRREELSVRRGVLTPGSMYPHRKAVEKSNPAIDVAPITASPLAVVAPPQSGLGIGPQAPAVPVDVVHAIDGWGEQPVPPVAAPDTRVGEAAVAPSGEGRGLTLAEFGSGRVGKRAIQANVAAPSRDFLSESTEVPNTGGRHYSVAPISDSGFGAAGAVSPMHGVRRPLRKQSDAPAGERGGRRSFDGGTAFEMDREQVSGAPSGMFSERAAAPQPDAGGRQDEGRALVMLDGRLVGEMLSGRLARDASRPGAGTTSFDARQAPAWTPSGAI